MATRPQIAGGGERISLEQAHEDDPAAHARHLANQLDRQGNPSEGPFCVRDGVLMGECAAIGFTILDDVYDWQAQRPRNLAQEGVVAVSYTQLTLPPLYSV